jgi:hypothetical protein
MLQLPRRDTTWPLDPAGPAVPESRAWRVAALARSSPKREEIDRPPKLEEQASLRGLDSRPPGTTCERLGRRPPDARYPGKEAHRRCRRSSPGRPARSQLRSSRVSEAAANCGVPYLRKVVRFSDAPRTRPGTAAFGRAKRYGGARAECPVSRKAALTGAAARFWSSSKQASRALERRRSPVVQGGRAGLTSTRLLAPERGSGESRRGSVCESGLGPAPPRIPTLPRIHRLGGEEPPGLRAN